MSLTIVIPTKDRHHPLIHAVKSCLRLHQLTQLIILDSSTPPPGLIQQLTSLDDRVEYHLTPKTFNAVQNFNFGVPLITGDYCMYIGDDDFVTSRLDNVVQMMIEKGMEACSCTYPVNYQWPGFRTVARGNQLSSTLVLRPFSGRWRKLTHPRNEMKSAARSSHLGPQQMPRIYLGVVSTLIIKKILSRGLNIFGGVSPDVYSSVLISDVVKEYYELDYPFVVPGAAPASTSALAARGAHNGNFTSNPHLASFPALEWNPKIPEIYCPETVWSFSFQAALDAVGKGETINYNRLLGSLTFTDRDSFTAMMKQGLMQNKGSYKYFVFAGTAIFKGWLQILRTWVATIRFYILPSNKNQILAGIRDASEAFEILEAISDPFLDPDLSRF